MSADWDASHWQGRMPAIVQAARAAGDVIMQVYATDFEVRDKDDDSPVTQADEWAERVIVPALQALDPGIPIVAEEAVAAGRLPTIGDLFWLVDPLDGTREFIDRNGQFTVNIALVHHGRPVLGVVLIPAQQRLFAGLQGAGAWVEDAQGRRAIRCRATPREGLTVVASRSHGDAQALEAFLAGQPVARVVQAGSSLKLCLIAAGEADVYPRFGRTMAWDIAAGHAVLAAAGGEVTDLAGQPLRYGQSGLENPHFVARGRGAGSGGTPASRDAMRS